MTFEHIRQRICFELCILNFDIEYMSNESVAHTVHSPRGTELTCKNWQIEAAYRMIQNNLDPEVAEKPEQLIVYGGYGKAARNWPAFQAILDSLRTLEPDETLLVQSGKPVGIVKPTWMPRAF